jgi:hypothetical protein
MTQLASFRPIYGDRRVALIRNVRFFKQAQGTARSDAGLKQGVSFGKVSSEQKRCGDWRFRLVWLWESGWCVCVGGGGSREVAVGSVGV